MRFALAIFLVWLSAGCAQFRAPTRCGPSGCGEVAAPAIKPAFDVAGFKARNGQAPFDATCRIGVADRDGTTSWGSGTVVERFGDGAGLVVTNEHVVRDRRSDQSGHVMFRRGEQSALRVLAVDPVWDLAVLEVQLPTGLAPAKVAETPVALGETLAVAGYSNKGFLEASTGVYVQRAGVPAELLDVRPCSARSGDSGGPMFNSAGALVGCLWGSDGGRTLGAPGNRIRALLDRVRARMGSRFQLPSSRAQPSGQPANAAQPSATPAIDPEKANLRAHIRELEAQLAAKAKAAAKPAIAAAAEDLKQEAEQQTVAAAPGLLAKLLPLAVTALSGFGLPVAGTTGALWLAAKLGGRVWTSFQNRRKTRPAKYVPALTPLEQWAIEAAKKQGGLPIGKPEIIAPPPSVSSEPSQTVSTIAAADSTPAVAAPQIAAPPKTRIEYVRIPTIDPEGENYREMMRRMANVVPALAPYFEQLESGKQALQHGQQVTGRLSPAAIAPHDDSASETP